jgi:O-antigen/teichoic acid export membrane protein
MASMLVNQDSHVRMLVLIIAIGILFQPISIADLYFQSRLQSKYVVYAQMMALAIASAVRIILIQLRAPLIGFAIALLLETVLSMLALAWFYRRHYGNLRFFSVSKSVAVRLLAETWPLALTVILTSMYVNIDRVLIKQLLGDASAGKYAVVLSLSTALYFIPLAFGQSLFPSLVEARENTALYHQRLQQAFDVLLWTAVALALPVTFAAGPIIGLLYGPAYAGAGEALAILIWSAVVTFVGLVTSYWLVVENLQRLYPIRIFASLCTCVLLNVLLIPRLGIRGAAIATVAAQFVSSTVVYAFNPRTRLMVQMQLRALALPVRLWTSRHDLRHIPK